MILNGVLLALIAAMSLSLSGVAKKGLSNRGHSQLAVIWGPVATCLPLLALYFFSIGIPETQWGPTLLILLLVLPLMILSEFLWVWGITAGDYSLAVPFASFGPVFGLVAGFSLFGEIPTVEACAGLVLVVIGAYGMNFKDAQAKGHGLWAPFVAIVKTPGPRWILLNALVFTGVGSLQKLGGSYTTPLFFAFLTLVAEFLVLGLMLAGRRENPLAYPARDRGLMLANGLTWTVGFICIYLAFSKTLIVYAIGIEQSSILFAILWGYLFFKEKGIAGRLGAAFLMFVGVSLITVFAG